MTAPLSTIRVITVALNLPGPVAAAELHRHGAEVTTLVPPHGDPMAGYSRSLYDLLHHGQEVRTVDLRSEEGRATAHGLLAEADLLITSSRPGALVRMGMDFATTSALNPRLCQVDIVGFPGARAEEPGHDLTYQADNGLVDADLPHTLISDMAGGQQAVTEALLALRLRDAGGVGVRREVALSTAAEFMALPLVHGLTGPGDLLGGAEPMYAVYPTADGMVALAALEPHFRERVLATLGTGSGEDLRRLFATRPTAYWTAWAAEHDVPLSDCR